MQQFNGAQYLLIDIANNMGLDKELFETRIEWTKKNIEILETLTDEADEPYLYAASVKALRDTQAGKPTGHRVAFDACASGLQILACLSGCPTTAKNVGLINPNERSDFYSKVVSTMNRYLPKEKHIGVGQYTRADVKEAAMTTFYGSVNIPKQLFGEDSEELKCYYKALYELAPGAMAMTTYLINTWDANTLVVEWDVPDGFEVVNRIMVNKDRKIEIDELDGASFTHRFKENDTLEYSPSNSANFTHSLDGLIVRELSRRTLYKPHRVRKHLKGIKSYLKGYKYPHNVFPFVSVNTLDYIEANGIENVPKEKLFILMNTLEYMLTYTPFPVLSVHDSFSAHANNMNHVRQTYINLLAEIADSDLTPVKKIIGNLGGMIAQSNYPLS